LNEKTFKKVIHKAVCFVNKGVQRFFASGGVLAVCTAVGTLHGFFARCKVLVSASNKGFQQG
jgi:hypothetical protein